MMQPKIILFDNDGVLSHTEELFFELNTKVFNDMGIDYSRQDFEHHTFLANLGTSGFMKARGYTSEHVKDFQNKRDALWQTMIKQRDVTDPAAAPVLDLLKQKYKIGMVTNTPRPLVLVTYHNSRILELLDFLVAREDYEKGKPEPDSYLKGLEIAGYAADEALVVEDSPRGIAAAKAAGIPVVCIPNPVIKGLDTSQADYHITSLSELPGLLELTS